MPKAPRRCPGHGCTNLIRSARYCPDCQPDPWSTPSGWQRPANWDRDRQHVLERDNWTCYLCGQPGADTVDHVQPQHQGGPDTLDNYRAVHDRNWPHCHRTKTNQDRARPTAGH
ncbi:HNH endonuclease [Nocardia puris]|uniref:5-methylcytosine-specific restriction protein A n=1 Tax=Nocardia puris TaxID=208602 RepID=A0A366DCQ9_9NOCA|nr:HNH endonuclease [Nocardia puris]RBO87038.1 5-methylcytosine-specific restriction protein A [Nocardia puris]